VRSPRSPEEIAVNQPELRPQLHLISHHLCPYVQRAIITLTEKGAPHERTYIDLAAKPDWFKAVSPLGKVPLLLVGGEGGTAIFESAVICEFLEETVPGKRLHPEDPIERARHRAWIEFASATLASIAGLYAAPDADAFDRKRADLAAKFDWLNGALSEGPYFAGEQFSLVDAAFAPVFRYFDAFEVARLPLRLFDAAPKVRNWRTALAMRPSVGDAVPADYPARLATFLRARGSHLSRLIASYAT
jgi:glutathione S-transferase